MTSLDLTWAVRSVDGLLRLRQGIKNITDDRLCILRIAVAPSPRTVDLSDGTVILVGDPVARIHYWNEHLPLMPREGPNAAWATTFMTRLRYSFRLMAVRLERDPQLAAVRGVQGSPAFAYRFGGAVQLSRICERLGFDVIELDHDDHFAGRIHIFFDSVLVWGLIWAFNPGALKSHGLAHRRIQVWMSRDKLIGLYGSSPKRRPGPREVLVKDVEPI